MSFGNRLECHLVGLSRSLFFKGKESRMHTCHQIWLVFIRPCQDAHRAGG
jgi:hypothetical protein